MTDLEAVATDLVRAKYGNDLGILGAQKLKADVLGRLRAHLEGVPSEHVHEAVARFRAEYLYG